MGFASILVVVIIGFIVYVVKKARDEHAISRATAETQGTILHIYRFYDSEDHNTTYYWVVRYSVGGMTYRFMQEAYGMSRESMEAHAGEEVAVFYDPEKPDKAWADTPGKHAYANSKARSDAGSPW